MNNASAVPFRAAVVQINSGDDVGANLRAAREGLEAARAQGAVLAVLPENFAFMGARERDKLRVKAYMETNRFDRCAQLGSSSVDPEVQRWVQLCNKRMQ